MEGGLAAANPLFRAIGTFLSDQRLEPTPVNYAFAYRVVGEPDGVLSQSVAAMTDGGIRLTAADIDALGERVEPAARHDRRDRRGVPDRDTDTERLAAATRQQVAGFESMMLAMRTETQDFGRDLAASEDALRRSHVPSHTPAGPAIDELARITAAMRQRVDIAEARLEQATREASELRTQLAEAQGDARRDALTGLPNRRAFEEALEATTAQPRHIAICDVDHFKSVNDRYGHMVGDRVLKAIAATLARECDGHLVARYGGEEFTLLLTGIDAPRACALVEAARIAVGERRYRLRESETLIEGVSLSAGIVTLRDDETIREALQRADQLLYTAKNEGRDRMVGEICQ